MANQENTTESSRQKYISSLKKSFITISKKALLAALAAIPGVGTVLAWGPFPYLSGLAIEWALEKIVNGAETGFFFLYVDFRVASQSKDFTAASIRNYEVQSSPTSTKEEKYAAEKNLIETFDRFVKLNNLS